MDLSPDPHPPPQSPPHLPPAADADPSFPPYVQMIKAAIAALNERNGSSKRSIAAYIEAHYPNLPPTHSSLLTDHLIRLKDEGQILMVKQSYKLPAPAAVNGSSDPASAGSKRRPGRPPKPKSDAVQAPVPVFAHSVDINVVPGVVPAAVGPVNGPEPGVVPARGRGRPPKRGPGRPPKAVGVGTGRPRGRPKKSASLSLAIRKGLGRPRGRPPKAINLSQGLAHGAPFGGEIVVAPIALGGAPQVGGVGAAPVLGKRRGRPPNAVGVAKKPRILIPVQPKKHRKLSGKPLGRPKKPGTQDSHFYPQPGTQDSQLLVAYLDLKSKLENLQTRIKQTAAFVKPSLNSEVAINALQELELAALNVVVPSNAPQSQQQP